MYPPVLGQHQPKSKAHFTKEGLSHHRNSPLSTPDGFWSSEKKEGKYVETGNAKDKEVKKKRL